MKNKLLILLAIVFYTCKKESRLEETNCTNYTTSYQYDIVPIIKTYCQSYSCHHQGDTNGDFSNYAGVKEKADNGSLNHRVLIKKDMPRPDLRQIALSDLRKIKCWLEAGAPDN
jgi:hypothetical protein